MNLGTDLLSRVLDSGSLASWDMGEEAVRTGAATIAGRPVAVIAGDFAFSAGTIGQATVGRVVAAIERATSERLPLLALPVSGGTRVQEGTPAFVGMAEIVLALDRFRAARLAYVVHLRGPTTGGVLASWASLGDVTFAEPGALIGFLGPRVQAALPGGPIPAGVQTAENLHRHGLVDAVVPASELRPLLARTLGLVAGDSSPSPSTCPDEEPADGGSTDWSDVIASRRPDRPRLPDLLGRTGREVVRLRGTGEGERGDGMFLALARLGGHSTVVLGPDRAAQLDPAAFRVARRGIALASRLGLPLVAVVDTPGAEVSAAAEEGGIAAAIARTLADVVGADTRTVSVLLGEGGGGGALALLPADVVVAAARSWLCPLAPEAAAGLLYRDPGRAAEAAADLRIGALDLQSAGLVDMVVAERPDAAEEPGPFLDRLEGAIGRALDGLVAGPATGRGAARARRLACARRRSMPASTRARRANP